MVTYRLRPADMEYVRRAASMYAEAKTSYRQWMPVEQIPLVEWSKWYGLNRFQSPGRSMDGSVYSGVRTGRTENSNPVLWLRFGFTWTRMEVENAQRTGTPLQADDFAVAMRQMDKQIAQLILEGVDWPVAISGFTEAGTDGGTPLDAVMWGTNGAPILHANSWYGSMMTAGFLGPYAWVVSTALMPYLKLPITNTGIAQGDYVQTAYGCTIYPEPDVPTASFDASQDAETIYAWQHTADDGIWCALANQPENFTLQECIPPTYKILPEMDTEHNVYRGYLEWAGTLRIQYPTAIQFMEDVDLA